MQEILSNSDQHQRSLLSCRMSESSKGSRPPNETKSTSRPRTSSSICLNSTKSNEEVPGDGCTKRSISDSACESPRATDPKTDSSVYRNFSATNFRIGAAASSNSAAGRWPKLLDAAYLLTDGWLAYSKGCCDFALAQPKHIHCPQHHVTEKGGHGTRLESAQCGLASVP